MRYIGPMPGVGNLITDNPVPWYDVTLSAPGRFDVTGIPPGYILLRGILIARSSVAAITDGSNFFLNGDTTVANYRIASHWGGGTHSAAQADSTDGLALTAANSLADNFGVTEFTIPLYAGNKAKTIILIFGRRADATTILAQHSTIYWENTTAINQITLQPDGYATDNFVAGSQLQIWLYR